MGYQNAPRVNAIQEQAWPQTAGTLVWNAETEDGAGNTIIGWATIDDHVGFAYLALLAAGTGTLLDEVVVIPAAGMKCDTASMRVRGDRVRVRFGNHQPGPGQPEGLSRDVYDWRPRGFVPIPFGAADEGRPGAYPVEDTGGSGVGLSPEDKTWIQQQLTAAIDEFDHRLGGQAPREDIKGLIAGQLQQQGVLRTGSTDAEKYSILRGNNRDGAYEAIVSYFGPKAAAQAPTEAPQQPGLPDSFTERSSMSGIYEGEDQ